MENSNSIDPLHEWTLPGDAMRNHKLKAKRRALRARMNTSLPLQILSPKQSPKSATVLQKRRNPFRNSLSKMTRLLDDSDSSEHSNDTDLFKKFQAARTLIPNSSEHSLGPKSSFQTESKTEKIENVADTSETTYQSVGLTTDWSLKTKLRFTTSKPMPWKPTFKSSEEASGTTGFVRCMDPQSDSCSSRTLDTSKNAQFYQCCLTWQHPNLPMVSLFPRHTDKVTPQTGLFGLQTDITDALHRDWKESLRSLFHLLRVRQCPFFYVCGPSFTCLFRAAGVAAIPHAHALITEATFGFREAMKKEGIEFKMPFFCSNPDEEADLDDEEESGSQVEEGEDFGDHVSWLQDLGIEASKIPKLSQNKSKRSASQPPQNSSNTLVYVQDMELHGFFNFLLNCTSCVSKTGRLAGVPPTLLAPVAFHGATLKALKASGGIVRTKEGKTVHNLELSGPILPTTLLQLSNLFASNMEDFIINIVNVSSTSPFCENLTSDKETIPSAFAEEGLIDCGLSRHLCSTICKPMDEESEKWTRSSREISYSDGFFTRI